MSKAIHFCLLILLTVFYQDPGALHGVHAITGNVETPVKTELEGSEKNITKIPGDLQNPDTSQVVTEQPPSVTTLPIIPAAAPEAAQSDPTKDTDPAVETEVENPENVSLNDPDKTTTTTTALPVVPPITNATLGADLPDKGAVEREHNSSMSLFFVLCVIACGILLIHLMLQTGFQYLPESIVVVVLGALIGMFINVLSEGNIANWKREEVFSPTAFFLVLLPPIIFESGYNLHKGK